MCIIALLFAVDRVKSAAISLSACGWKVKAMTCRGGGVGEGVGGVGVPPR